MDTKHTPSPWHRNIKPARKYNTIFAGRNTHIAMLATYNLTDEEIEGNCNLITSAPELLEALEELTRIASKQLDQSATHDGLTNISALRLAFSAIAKAKGGA